MNCKSAIFLFQRSPKRESLIKKLIRRDDRVNRQFIEWMNRRMGYVCRKVEADFYVFNGDLQKGEGFGQRLQQGFRHFLDLGYEQVIAIGNDTLQLKEEDMVDAIELLRDSDCVVGPSEDGGIYLLGLRRESFDDIAFGKIGWNTSTVGKELLDSLKRSTVCLLQVYYDMDKAHDIHKFLQSQNDHYLIAIIRAFITRVILATKTIRTFFARLFFPSSHQLRAPPH